MAARPSNEDAQLGVLLADVALFVASYSAAFVLVPLAAAASSASTGTVGLVAAMPGIVGVTLAIPSASMSNRFGRRPLMLASFIILCAATGGYIASREFIWLIPSQLALGLAMIAFWPSALAAFAELPGKRGQELRQGLNTLLQGVGSFAGSLAAGVVAGAVGFPLAFVMLVPLCVVGLAAAAGVQETATRSSRSSLSIEVSDAIRTAVSLWRRDRAYVMAVLALAPWSMLWWVAGATFFVLYVTSAGYSPAFAGALVALRIGIGSALRVVFAQLAKRSSLAQLMLVGNAVGGLALAAAALSTNAAWLAGSAVIQGAGLAVVLPASNVMVMQCTRGRERAVGLAMSSSMTNCAILVAPPLLAATSVWAGLGGTLAVAGILATASSVVLARLL